MKGGRVKGVRATALALAIGAGCAPVALRAADPALESRFKQLLQHDFRARGSAGLERLEQDPLQKVCTETRDHPSAAEKEDLREAQRKAIRWPADQHFLGDW